jgi:hypothetical protein
LKKKYIYKKGNRTDAVNYCPISPTSINCKIMEKLFRNAPLQHMISEELLSDYQHGFIMGRSCTTQLLQVIDKWTEILDEEGSVDVICLDLTKPLTSYYTKSCSTNCLVYGVG